MKVKHDNGQLFHPLELSQSTKEMLYISLRLSLIKALKGYYRLPLIIDDAFVHFDKERKKIIMDYLRNEVQDQVLYFTCNLDNSIPASQTIKLKEKIK
ncbi:ATP-binding protein [Salinicoccus sp. CNSTN-B1]